MIDDTGGKNTKEFADANEYGHESAGECRLLSRRSLFLVAWRRKRVSGQLETTGYRFRANKGGGAASH